MAKELKHLSQLVKRELAKYDREEAQSLSIVYDLSISDIIGDILECGFGCITCAGAIISIVNWLIVLWVEQVLRNALLHLG